MPLLRRSSLVDGESRGRPRSPLSSTLQRSTIPALRCKSSRIAVALGPLPNLSSLEETASKESACSLFLVLEHLSIVRSTIVGRTSRVKCVPHPFCGDSVVQGACGEICDDGVNSGVPGSCSADCKTPFCGDGIIEPEIGEECDVGGEDGFARPYPHCALCKNVWMY